MLGCAVRVYVYLTLEKNIYEKHLYDKLPLECEARQCYDADYKDSLSPLTFSGEWSEDSSFLKISNRALAFYFIFNTTYFFGFLLYVYFPV